MSQSSGDTSGDTPGSTSRETSGSTSRETSAGTARGARDVDVPARLAPSESLGLTVCRLGLDPASGRIRHRSQLGAAIRGALFVELVLEGRLSGNRLPRAIGESQTGQRLPDAVHAAIVGRGPTPWKRWFSHVGADVDAAVRTLVESGVWSLDKPRRYLDVQADLTSTQAVRVTEFLATTRAPGELEDAVVALLVGGAGVAGRRPRPRAQLMRLDRVLTPLLPADSGQGTAIRAAVRGALKAMRGRSWPSLRSR